VNILKEHMRLRILSLAILVLLAIASCENENERVAAEVIDREQFVDILAEVQILESTHQFIKSKNKDFRLDYNYQWIYKEYGITEEEFKASVDYYSADPEVFEELFDEVIIKISEKQAELEQKPQE
jgi:hypothetical protein